MSATTLSVRRGRPFHPVALTVEIVACLVILAWTLTPLYSMVSVALEAKDDVFSGALWPASPTLGGIPDRADRGLLVRRAVLA